MTVNVSFQYHIYMIPLIASSLSHSFVLLCCLKYIFTMKPRLALNLYSVFAWKMLGSQVSLYLTGPHPFTFFFILKMRERKPGKSLSVNTKQTDSILLCTEKEQEQFFCLCLLSLHRHNVFRDGPSMLECFFLIDRQETDVLMLRLFEPRYITCSSSC